MSLVLSHSITGDHGPSSGARAPSTGDGDRVPSGPWEQGPDGISPHSSAFKLEADDAPVKRCPKCKVYIERDEGCAQMMCKNCKHAFCWYCLESLDVSTALTPTRSQL